MTNRKAAIKDLILKHRGFFSLDKIVEETHVSRRAAQKILDSLASEGLIRETRHANSVGRPGIYRINRAEQGEELAVNRMWSVIRNKSKADGFFALRDLIVLGEVKRETARAFIKSLRRAEIIAPNKPTGRGVRWTLLEDPGPRRPYVGDQSRAKREVH